MTLTKQDILARYFFDLAGKIEDIAGTDVAQSVDSFTNDDYASIAATMLDAAYWILGDQLPEDSDVDFYVSSNVYNDLVYRGYSPVWAWEESGMVDLWPDEKRAASEFAPGTYVVVQHEDGVRGGVMVASNRMYSFDGGFEDVGANQLRKITIEQAVDMLDKYADQITDGLRRRAGRNTRN